MNINWRSWPQGNVPSEHRPRKCEDYLVFLRNGLIRMAYLDKYGEWRDTTTEAPTWEQWDAGVIRWAQITPPEEESPAPSPREGAEGSLVEDLYKALDELVNDLDLRGDPQWFASAMERRCRAALDRARGEGS